MNANSGIVLGQIGNGWSECGAPEVVLRAIFKGLDAAGVDYCVMRNFELLPRSVGNSDLDILLRPEQHGIAERAVRKSLMDFGGDVVARVPARGSYLKTMGCTDGKWWGLAIDLVADVDFRGMVYITADEVISRSVNQDEVRVASAADAALGALAKELINNLTAEARYVENARRVWLDDGADCLMSLGGFDVGVRKMVGDLLENHDVPVTELRQLGIAMRRDLEARQGLGRRLMTAIGEMYRRVQKVLCRPGALIVFTGDDSATVRETLERMLPVLKRAFHKRVLVAGGEPGNLAEDLALLPRDSEGKERRRGLLFRYGVNYFRYAFPRMMGKPHLICSIGYFDKDQYGKPLWIGRFVRAFLPKPDLVFRLGGVAHTSTVGQPRWWHLRKGVCLVACHDGRSGAQACAALASVLQSLSDRVRP